MIARRAMLGLLGDSGGGGGEDTGWKLLATKNYTFTEEPPTSTTEIDSFTLDATEIYTSEALIYSIARRKNFVNSPSTFIGCDWVYANVYRKQFESADLTTANRNGFQYYVNASGKYAIAVSGANSSGGILVNSISSNGTVKVASRRIANWGSMVGEYTLYIYALKWPNNALPFA